MNDNKRLALNTIILYAKLVVSTLVGLYVSRVVLNALGADDYGLYSVVGGIVTFLNVIGTTMVSVSYRYLAVELGKGEEGDPNRIYNTVYLIHIFLAAGLVLIGETGGLFYVNHYLNVLPDKVPDACFVLHVSLITTAISIMSVPINGLIIAKEKFVFTSLVEVITQLIKLGLVILLAHSSGNRLREYAIIAGVITLLIRISYQIYGRVLNKEIIKWKVNKNKEDYKSVFSFAWWSLFGATASVGKDQGSAMIINFFFGTRLNAAFGIATQVNRYVSMFTGSIHHAAVPQIMKSYGAGNQNRSLSLVYTISRISALMMLIPAVPLLLCLDDILVIWLKNPPEYASIFVTFLIINGFVSILGTGFDPCIQSTGKIKKNEIGYGLIYLLLLPIIWVLYKIGCPPYINVIVLPILTIAVRLFQTSVLKELTEFSFTAYFRETILPALMTVCMAVVPLIIIRYFWGHKIWETLVFLSIGVLWVIVSIWVAGLNKKEKNSIKNEIIRKIK